MGFFFSKKDKTVQPAFDYDPDLHRPVIRASICNGEQVAGFKDRRTGEFHEVMLIRGDADLALFLQTYGLTQVSKEY
ncbi:MAG: aspartate dehydrogenase [Lachnospiraceae bacterium]|nr:aspartate dehydrogenase [Lachnospiraceae bacterium]